jgi:hypothetical protein
MSRNQTQRPKNDSDRSGFQTPFQAKAPTPLRAVHTANFPGLLRRLGASLLVTTYQAGKLVLVRAEDLHCPFVCPG